MSFEDVDRRFEELRGQVQVGTLSTDELGAQLQQMSVTDDRGRRWIKNPLGDWYYNEGGSWIKGDPYSSQPTTSYGVQPPTSSTTYTTSTSSQEGTGATYGAQGGGGYASTPQQPVGAYAGQQQAVPYGVQPVSSGMTIAWYLLSFFFAPIAGVILYFVYRDRPFEQDRRVGKNSLIISLVTFFGGALLYCLCVFLVLGSAGVSGA